MLIALDSLFISLDNSLFISLDNSLLISLLYSLFISLEATMLELANDELANEELTNKVELAIGNEVLTANPHEVSFSLVPTQIPPRLA